MNDKKIKKLTICIVVWGADFTDLFLELILPAYYSKNNLQALSTDWEIEFLIATDLRSEEEIRSSKIFATLSQIATFSFLRLHQDQLENHKYQVWSSMNEVMIKYCIQKKRVAVMGTPDFLISDGSLKNALDCLSDEIWIVKTPTHYRAIREKVKQATLPAYKKEDGSFEISSYELAKYGYDFMHSHSSTQFITSKKQHECKSISFCKISDAVVVARAAHLHPFVIDCRVLCLNDSISNISIDSGVSESFNCTKENIYLMSDSREFGGLELSPENMEVPFEKKTCKFPPLAFMKALIWLVREVDSESQKNFLNNVTWIYLDDRNQKINRPPPFYFVYSYCFYFLIYPYAKIRQILVHYLERYGLKEPTKKLLESLCLR